MNAFAFIVVVILGVGLMLIPLIFDHLREVTTAKLLEVRPDLNEFSLSPGMSGAYRWFCWITGGFMILVSCLSLNEISRTMAKGTPQDQIARGDASDSI